MTFRNVSSFNKLYSRPPYLAHSCLIVSLVHGLNCHNLCVLKCRCLAHSQLSLFRRGVICKRPLSVTTGRSSDLKQWWFPKQHEIGIFLCSTVKFKEKDPQIWKRLISRMCFNSHASELLMKDLKQLRAISDPKSEEYSDTAVERSQLTAVLRRHLQVGNHSFLWGWQYHRIWAHDGGCHVYKEDVWRGIRKGKALEDHHLLQVFSFLFHRVQSVI